MLLTLENALNKIAELESRIVRLERIVTGTHDAILTVETPTQQNTTPIPSDQSFPQLNGDFMEEQAESKIPTLTKVKSSLPTPIHVTSEIERDYPNIADNITLVWGSPECKAYLDKLMLNSRGDRQGFNLEIMAELMLLTAITEHDQADIWALRLKASDNR